MYEEYEEMNEIEEIERAEGVSADEVQELLKEAPDEVQEEAAEESEEGKELHSRQAPAISFGSASEKRRFYEDQLERDLKSTHPAAGYWARKDAYEVGKAKEEADQEAREVEKKSKQ